MAQAPQQPFQFSLGALFRLTTGAALLIWLTPLYPLVLFVVAVYLGGTLMLMGLISLLYLSAIALASVYDACTRVTSKAAEQLDPVPASNAHATIPSS